MNHPIIQPPAIKRSDSGRLGQFLIPKGGENEAPGKPRSVTAWNPKQPYINDVNGCFNWMISNLYIGNGWFTISIHLKKGLFGVPFVHLLTKLGGGWVVL